MIGVTVKHSLDRDLLRYLTDLTERTDHALVDAGLAAIDSARETNSRTTTRRTGALEDSWHAGWTAPHERVVTNFAKHARFIESGTRPHRITARNVRFLRFEVNGVTVFRRSVFHPGTKARPFVALAMAAGQMTMRASLEVARDRAAEGF